jgi:hypothetical protein
VLCRFMLAMFELPAKSYKSPTRPIPVKRATPKQARLAFMC